MKKFTLMFIFIFILQISFLPILIEKNNNNASLIPVNNDNQLNPLGLEDMYPSSFENSLLKIYKLGTTFDFVFSSSTLTYGIYIAAMFVEKDFQNVYLVFYVFVNTMNDYYVSSLTATFNFDLTCTYSGNTIQASGSPSDSSSFMQFGPELYEYYLHNETIPKNLLFNDLSISIDYIYTSSEFSESGTISASAYLPALSDGDFVLLITLLILMIVIGVSTGIVLFIVKRRRNRDPDETLKLNKSRYGIQDEGPIDTSNMDTGVYNMFNNMSVKEIIRFLKDNRKEVSEYTSKREITKWIQFLNKYPQTFLKESDCESLALDFNNW